MEFQWNTGRKYTERGQVIKAIQLAGGDVIFADLSRGIDGRLHSAPRHRLDTLEEMRDYVMHRYDSNDYSSDATSWKYHMGR